MRKLWLTMLVPLMMLGQENRPQPTEADLARMKAALPSAQVQVAKKRKVLVYHDTRGFYHTSIPFCTASLKLMGEATGAFEVTATDDASCFEPENLRQYDVIFLNSNTSRSPWGQKAFEKLPAGPERTALEAREARLRKAFLDFVRADGKGVVGIHAATDAMYDWPEYGEMMGGFFNAHPWSETVGVELCDAGHPLMRGWNGVPFAVNDEIYQQKEPYSRDKQRVLMRLDTARTNMTKPSIRRTDGDFALAWIKPYGKGRVCYIAFGHRHELFWNRGMLTMMLDAIQYAAGDLKVDDRPSNQVEKEYWAQSARDGFARGIVALVAQLKGYRYSVDDTAARQIDALANRLESPEGEAQGRLLAAELAKLLTAESSVDARNFAMRQISRLGGEPEVAAVAAQLADAATADMALYCLQRLPGADGALVEALARYPQQRGGIALALGMRRSAAAAGPLTALLADEKVRSQAAQALGAIGTQEAAAGLKASLQTATGAFRQDVYAALATIVASGVEAAAREAADVLSNAADAASHLRATGVAKRTVLAGAAGLEQALEELKRGDAFICSAVAEALIKVPGGLAAALAQVNVSLPPMAACQVLRAAGLSGDAALEPQVLTALAGKDDAVGIAAAQALEALGGKASVKALAMMTEGPRAAAAQKALQGLRGEGVSAVLLAESVNAQNDEKTRARMIQTLGLRKEGTAAEYGKLILGKEPLVAKEALAALALTVKETDAAVLVALLGDVQAASVRSRLVKTAAAAGRHAEKPDVYAGVFAQGLAAAKEPPVREALITVLGKLGQDSTCAQLEASLKSTEDGEKRAAILALSEWPTSRPLPALRAVSTDDKASEAHRVLALRGYAHLLALPSKRAMRETLALYREAFALAKSAQEKQSLLHGLGDLIHPEALALAEQYQTDAALTNEATLAAARIWQGLNGAQMELTSFNGGNPRAAMDGNRGTRWTSGRKQQGNEWFQVDLGYETAIEEIKLDAGDTGNDFPAAYEVWISLDGKDWGAKPVLTGKGDNKFMTLKLSNAYGRYIKIFQKGTTPSNYWSICEMSVNGIPASQGTAIPVEKLKVTVSRNAADIPKMLDGKRDTRWTTGGPQRAGDWMCVELPEEKEITRLVLDAAGSGKDFPYGYNVHVSRDGKDWGVPVAFGHGDKALTAIYPLPRKARFVKVTLTESDNTYFWSIHALEVFAR